MNLELLKTALRVLNAYAIRTFPEEADVAFLRLHAVGEAWQLEPDALAVHIIQQQLEQIQRDRADRTANG